MTVETEPYAFITGDEFESRVPVSQNVSKGKPFPQCVRTAQMNYLKPLLGKALYAEMQTAYKAFAEPPNTAMTEPQQALMFHIKEVVAWRTHYIWLKHNYTPTREVGTTSLQGPGTTVADTQEVKIKVREAEQFSETAEQAMRDHLNEEAASYPNWVNATERTERANTSGGLYSVDVMENILPGHNRNRRSHLL